MTPARQFSDSALPDLGPGESTTFTVGISIRVTAASVVLPPSGVVLAHDSWTACGFPASQELSLSGVASACGLAPQAGVDGIGAIEVTVTNPDGGYDATDVSVDLFLGPPLVQPSRFPNFVDSRQWDSVPDGSAVSSVFESVDASTGQLPYVALLVWHDPSGTAFAADLVDITVPLCGAAGGGTGELPPTR
jgi:hypothetical protein